LVVAVIVVVVVMARCNMELVEPMGGRCVKPAERMVRGRPE